MHHRSKTVDNTKMSHQNQQKNNVAKAIRQQHQHNDQQQKQQQHQQLNQKHHQHHHQQQQQILSNLNQKFNQKKRSKTHDDIKLTNFDQLTKQISNAIITPSTYNPENYSPRSNNNENNKKISNKNIFTLKTRHDDIKNSNKIQKPKVVASNLINFKKINNNIDKFKSKSELSYMTSSTTPNCKYIIDSKFPILL